MYLLYMGILCAPRGNLDDKMHLIIRLKDISLVLVDIVVYLQKHQVEVAYIKISPFDVTMISIDRVRKSSSSRWQLMSIFDIAFIHAVL